MEEFIFVAPNGEIYRKELIGENVRHGHVAREYMESKKLPIYHNTQHLDLSIGVHKEYTKIASLYLREAIYFSTPSTPHI